MRRLTVEEVPLAGLIMQSLMERGAQFFELRPTIVDDKKTEGNPSFDFDFFLPLDSRSRLLSVLTTVSFTSNNHFKVSLGPLRTGVKPLDTDETWAIDFQHQIWARNPANVSKRIFLNPITSGQLAQSRTPSQAVSADVKFALYLLHIIEKPYKYLENEKKGALKLELLLENTSSRARQSLQFSQDRLVDTHRRSLFRREVVSFLQDRRVEITRRPLQREHLSQARNILSVCGPDGSGKTSLTDILEKRFDKTYVRKKVKTLYRKSRIYKTLSIARPRNLGQNLFDERILPVPLFLSLLGLRKRLRDAGTKGLLVERSFYELAISRIRESNRTQRIKWQQLGLSALMPRMRYVVLLACSWETSFLRRGELDLVGWSRFYSGHQEMISASNCETLFILSSESQPAGELTDILEGCLTLAT